MANIDKLIELLCEKFDETPLGGVMIVCLTLIGIALIVDTMLTHTYPAYTLIGIIILIGSTSYKAYINHKRYKK